MGAGPVDSIYQAIQNIVRVPNRLVSYGINSVTQGMDAIGEVTAKLESIEDYESSPDTRRRLQRMDSGVDADEFKNPQTGNVTHRTFTGHGADTDILVASAKSYLSALNRMIVHKKSQTESMRRAGSL